jgi:hypothetical protein
VDGSSGRADAVSIEVTGLNKRFGTNQEPDRGGGDGPRHHVHHRAGLRRDLSQRRLLAPVCRLGGGGGDIAPAAERVYLLSWWLATIVLTASGLAPIVVGYFTTFRQDVT